MINEWRLEDPRFSINKRANIIVVDRRSPQVTAAAAFVDTKDEWYIHIGGEIKKSLRADDEWPEGFVWNWAPQGGVFK